MTGYVEDQLLLAKLCSSEYITASKKITARPCFVFNLVIKSKDSDDAAIVNLRNGETVLDDILIAHLTKYARTPTGFHYPVYFNRGLYVEIGGQADGVFVQYIQE